jgi:menaquinone-specific isochorismate synthase
MKRWDHSPLRGRFGAPFGGFYRETASAELSQHCLVAIRNIQWQKTDVQLGSGCGIVPDSRLENEWDELKLKRESVKRMLGI